MTSRETLLTTVLTRIYIFLLSSPLSRWEVIPYTRISKSSWWETITQSIDINSNWTKSKYELDHWDILSHKGSAMLLKCWSRQRFGEYIRWLILASHFVKLDFAWLWEFLDAINTSINVLGPIIHAWTLDQEDACIIILCDWSRERLSVSHHFHDSAQIHTVKCTLWHTVKFTLGAGYRCHRLPFRRPSDCSSI